MGETVELMNAPEAGITIISDDNTSLLIIDTSLFFLPPGYSCLTLEVENSCGIVFAPGSGTPNVGVGPGCSLTQGFYGNLRGKFLGIPGIQLADGLLKQTDPQSGQPGLTVGVLGLASLTFGPDDVLCLVRRLPAGGPATTLPSADISFVGSADGTCDMVPIAVPLDRKGDKFRNVLLGQTITLALNTRLSSNLPGFPLSETFCTQGAIWQPDGTFMIADKSTIQQHTLPAKVLQALADLGLPSPVEGLLELANRALAGLDTGGANLSQINSAVTTINEAFDECRFWVQCPE